VTALDGLTYRLFYSASLSGSLLGLFIQAIYSELLYSSFCLYIWGQLPVKFIKQFILFYAAHTITHITVITIPSPVRDAVINAAVSKGERAACLGTVTSGRDNVTVPNYRAYCDVVVDVSKHSNIMYSSN
jgi:hypothetical protein